MVSCVFQGRKPKSFPEGGGVTCITVSTVKGEKEKEKVSASQEDRDLERSHGGEQRFFRHDPVTYLNKDAVYVF